MKTQEVYITNGGIQVKIQSRDGQDHYIEVQSGSADHPKRFFVQVEDLADLIAVLSKVKEIVNVVN